jgi:predicted metal-binding membrane protein
MTAETRSVATQTRFDLARVAPYLAPLLVVTALAWLWTYQQASDMGNMPGTMGMALPAFIAMWALMMTAMMLPSAAPVALLYTRTVQSQRLFRIGSFVAGYLLVWSVSGVAAYGLAWAVDRTSNETAGIALASAIFVVSGVYQLTPLKYACLSHCRSPLGHLFHYASWQGALVDFRIGLHHGGFCLACCWGLMALMAAFGLMNLWAMVGLAAIVALEKLWSRGPLFGRAVGVVSLALAVVVIFVPEIAPGVTGTPMGEMAMVREAAAMGG